MWIANLSNGTVVTEEDPVVGEMTSWQKLLAKCKEEGLRITGLRLGVGPALVNALGYKQCDGYFQAYEAIRYLFNSDVQRLKQGIGSVVGEDVYITWMEEGNNGLTYIWQEVRPLSLCKIHTTLA